VTSKEKIERIKSGKPFSAIDAILLCVLAALIAGLFYYLYRPRDAGDTAAADVRVDGQVYGSYPLNADAEIDVDGKLTVVIVNGAAYVSDASCPDRICEASGAIRRVHEMIICAPYGITVRIADEASDRLPGAR
jgi:hypothetical protein